jgi:alkanesulfonate monooxygenase SsuD/methylene tetrahydromethanopterin reductase-like flavin-dependent oxidoreductase (luciferase family)
MTLPKLSFGYLWDFRNPAQWRRPWAEFYAETLDLIAWTETIGVAGAWIPEHHLADDGYIPTPNLILAAIAARTAKLRIGSAVALAPLYDPVRFAEECAVLDILSGGRLEMALAIGYRRREYEALGAPFGKRGKRFDEFLEIATRLLAGEMVDFTGEHYRVKAAKLAPPAPRRTPLYIGGFADKALDRAIRFGDGYFGDPHSSTKLNAAMIARGLDPATLPVRIPDLYCAVADDPEAALDELAPYYHHVATSYGAWALEDQALGLDTPNSEPMSLDAFKTSGMLRIVTPDEMVESLRKLRERLPVEHYMFMRPPGLPADRFRHYAGILAEKVVPAFDRD